MKSATQISLLLTGFYNIFKSFSGFEHKTFSNLK